MGEFRIFPFLSERMERLQHLIDQLNPGTSIVPSPCSAAPTKPSPDDIVIVKSIRTAIGKAKRGSFKDTRPDQLLAPVLGYILESTGIPAGSVGDIVIGTVLSKGSTGATEVRIASLLAGFPEEVPVYTVNRQCSSGLQAIANVASAIASGQYDIGIGGGVESMSNNSMSWDGGVNNEALAHPVAKGCYLPMGVTSENVAEQYKIDRQVQDEFAVASHQKAANAQSNGTFRDEILPIEVEVMDKEGNAVKKLVDADEGIRAQTTMESLAKLPAVFKENGSTTAGNSSQLSDGAAASLLMKRSTAAQLGLEPLGVFKSYAVVGVDPSVMGIGPAVAIPEAVKRAGLTLDDIDLFEINEAFASQATYCVDVLRIDPAKVNVKGGAIALGHPLGCTGARMTATLLHEMKRRNVRYGVVSMCIGSGMGAAAVYERN